MEDRGNQQRTSASSMEGFLQQYKEKLKQEGGTLHKELKNEFTLLHFDESNQTMF